MSKDVFEEFASETPLQRKQRLMEKYGDKLGANSTSAQKSTAAPAKKAEAHTHPAQKKNVRVEKAYFESTAENQTAGEGCEEHYDERFVETDESPEMGDRIDFGELTEMQKIVVLGDVLNNPLWKR